MEIPSAAAAVVHADPAAPVTIALALVAGILSQALARHLKLPGIVLLLAAGVVLGPEVAGWVQPDSLGEGLQMLVGFAVAVILFEGGMNLNIKRLASEAAVIRRLITVGALITAVGAAVAARLIMNWNWSLAISFGALVIVTGPTVITPLLRRIKVKHSVETVLEAEGVLIDAIGAILAVVLLQVIISPSGQAIAGGGAGMLARLGVGLAIGVIGGFILGFILKLEDLVPEGLDNVFALSLVLTLFQLSNAFLTESGIMTVTAAGMVVGNMRTRVHRELLEFKEQLTVLFIGMLFILLAADVRLQDVVDLGWPGVITVATLMLVVRPLNVLVCTAGSKLTWAERGFISWLAPRGVVAAAVASVFCQALDTVGIEGGAALRALVFSVIAGTVLIQGLSGGLVAWALGLRRPAHRGIAILGANDLGRIFGRLLTQTGHEVILLDSNPNNCQLAQEEGLKVVFGNMLEERTLLRARLDERRLCLAVTTNDEVNLLFARRAVKEFKVKEVLVGCRDQHTGVTPNIIRASGARVLFWKPRDLELWNFRLRRGEATVEAWTLMEKPKGTEGAPLPQPLDSPAGLILPLVHVRGNRDAPVSDETTVKKGDTVHYLLSDNVDTAHEWLRGQGWEPAKTPEPES